MAEAGSRESEKLFAERIHGVLISTLSVLCSSDQPGPGHRDPGRATKAGEREVAPKQKHPKVGHLQLCRN